MKIKWDVLFGLERAQFEAMNENERFVYFLLLQYKSPYLWGRETPEGSDCSGAVCMALYAATGLLIRTTADDLYRRVFTRVNTRQNTDSRIMAAFFVTKDSRVRDGKTVPAGTALHIAGLLDEGVILNSASGGARVRTLNDISSWFLRDGCRMEIRGLDRAALEMLARERKTVYGLDDDFQKYFEV
jgi:murein DD-endopeptidase